MILLLNILINHQVLIRSKRKVSLSGRNKLYGLLVYSQENQTSDL